MFLAIRQTVDAPNRRLELRFRPDDGYSKPTCGDRHSTTGFLLRVRVKRNRIKQTKVTRSMSIDTTNLEVLSCAIHSEENLTSHLSEDQQIDNLSNIAIRRDSHEENAVNNLINQERDDNSVHYSTRDGIEEKSAIVDIRDLSDTCADTNRNSLNKKSNTLLTFDKNKYENLSHDTDYVLPRLKVLGRVDTEFKFTSM